MRNTITAIICIAALAACTPKPWTKPGTTSVQASRSLAECRHEALKATASCGNKYGCGYEQGVLERSCMTLKGFIL